MAARRVQQRQVMALLLATTALALPLSGAALFGGFDDGASGSAYLFLGAVSVQDFVPVLMLVGAFGLLVASSGPADERSSLASFVAGVVLAAGATLALAYVGSAYHLRAGGPFGFDERGAASGWTTVRLVTVASMVVTGVLCAAVAAQAAVWIGERKTELVR